MVELFDICESEAAGAGPGAFSRDRAKFDPADASHGALATRYFLTPPPDASQSAGDSEGFTAENKMRIWPPSSVKNQNWAPDSVMLARHSAGCRRHFSSRILKVAARR